MGFADGQIIDERYEILRMIGCGGHGTVYHAKDLELESDVAIKVLHKEFATDEAFKKRMKREARAMGQLAGTSAVQVFAFNETSAGETYLVMEYLEGFDLAAYLKIAEEQGDTLPLADALDILEPIATTLQAAHDRKIIHRDLKLANIFVLKSRARGRVRLLDFGLVKDMKQPAMTMPGQVAGSPAYIAPEAWLGKPDMIDHRIDVYSFTVVIYRVIAGQFPFDPHRSIVDVITDVCRGERPSLHEIKPQFPAAIDPWVAKALAIKPANRYQSIDELWQALERILKAA